MSSNGASDGDEAVRWQWMAVRCQQGRSSSMVQGDLTRGKRDGERSPNNLEVRRRRTETGSRLFECRPYQQRNSPESAIHESRAHSATTSALVCN